MYDESLSLAISKPQFDAEVQRINKIWCVVSTAAVGLLQRCSGLHVPRHRVVRQ